METTLPWSGFIESLGIPYPGPKPRRDWTNAAVIAELRKRRRRGLPLNAGAMQAGAAGLYDQGVKRFGSWDGAFGAAGIDPNQVRKQRVWTRKEVQAAIRARKRGGKSLARADVLADDGRLVRGATRLFPSSWARALAAAGLDPGLARGVPRPRRSRTRRRS